jgi:hypothetical protein
MTRFTTGGCGAAAILLHASLAQGQTSTADGVQALVRQDYQTALHILRPLAEAPSGRDPVAQFFLATIYESGNSERSASGAPNSVRACGLYKAAAQPANPFLSQALVLAQAIEEPLGPLAEKFCTTDPAILGPQPSIPAAARPAAVPPSRQATADAVSAYLRGDYDAAAALLLPIAARASRDNSAEFLLASLYDSGRGVPRDWLRACALYLRSAEGGAFQMQARTLWRDTRKRLTPEDAESCNRLASLGFGDGFQPVTFALEAGHSISWTLEGATITYQGRQRRIHDDLFNLRGIRFLPIQYSEVAVGPNRALRRHFMHVFIWVPQGPGKWVLLWQLFEAVHDELIEHTRDSLATVSAEEPPAGPGFDVRKLVRVNTTLEGDAELAILGGDHPRTVLIETEAERREEIERRAALDGPLDWKATQDLHRPPSFAYTVATGCGGVFLYALSKDGMETVTIHVDQDLLLAAPAPQTFDLAAQRTRIDAAPADSTDGCVAGTFRVRDHSVKLPYEPSRRDVNRRPLRAFRQSGRAFDDSWVEQLATEHVHDFRV